MGPLPPSLALHVLSCRKHWESRRNGWLQDVCWQWAAPVPCARPEGGQAVPTAAPALQVRPIPGQRQLRKLAETDALLGCPAQGYLANACGPMLPVRPPALTLKRSGRFSDPNLQRSSAWLFPRSSEGSPMSPDPSPPLSMPSGVWPCPLSGPSRPSFCWQPRDALELRLPTPLGPVKCLCDPTRPLRSPLHIRLPSGSPLSFAPKARPRQILGFCCPGPWPRKAGRACAYSSAWNSAWNRAGAPSM